MPKDLPGELPQETQAPEPRDHPWANLVGQRVSRFPAELLHNHPQLAAHLATDPRTPEPTIHGVARSFPSMYDYVAERESFNGRKGALIGARLKAINMHDPDLRARAHQTIDAVKSLPPDEQAIFDMYVTNPTALAQDVLGGENPNMEGQFDISGANTSPAQVAVLEMLIPQLKGRIHFDEGGINMNDFAMSGVDAVNAAEDTFLGLEPGTPVTWAAVKSRFKDPITALETVTHAVASPFALGAQGVGEGIAFGVNQLPDAGPVGEVKRAAIGGIKAAGVPSAHLLGVMDWATKKLGAAPARLSGAVPGTKEYDRRSGLFGNIVMIAVLHGGGEAAGAVKTALTTEATGAAAGMGLVLDEEGTAGIIDSIGASVDEAGVKGTILHPQRTVLDPAIRAVAYNIAKMPAETWVKGGVATNVMDAAASLADTAPETAEADMLRRYPTMDRRLVRDLLETPRDQMPDTIIKYFRTPPGLDAEASAALKVQLGEQAAIVQGAEPRIIYRGEPPVGTTRQANDGTLLWHKGTFAAANEADAYFIDQGGTVEPIGLKPDAKILTPDNPEMIEFANRPIPGEVPARGSYIQPAPITPEEIVADNVQLSATELDRIYLHAKVAGYDVIEFNDPELGVNVVNPDAAIRNYDPATYRSSAQARVIEIQGQLSDALSQYVEPRFPGGRSLPQFLHRIWNRPMTPSEYAIRNIISPGNTIKRWSNNVFGTNFNPDQTAWMERFSNQMDFAPRLYDISDVRAPVDAVDQITTNLNRYLKRLGFHNEEITEVTQTFLNVESPQDFYDARVGLSKRIDAHLPSNTPLDVRRRMTRISDRTQQDYVMTYRDPETGLVEPLLPGRTVAGTSDSLPSMPNEFIAESRLPNLKILEDATHSLKRWSRNQRSEVLSPDQIAGRARRMAEAEGIDVGEAAQRIIDTQAGGVLNQWAAKAYDFTQAFLHLTTGVLKPVSLTTKVIAIILRKTLDEAGGNALSPNINGNLAPSGDIIKDFTGELSPEVIGSGVQSAFSPPNTVRFVENVSQADLVSRGLADDPAVWATRANELRFLHSDPVVRAIAEELNRALGEANARTDATLAEGESPGTFDEQVMRQEMVAHLREDFEAGTEEDSSGMSDLEVAIEVGKSENVDMEGITTIDQALRKLLEAEAAGTPMGTLEPLGQTSLGFIDAGTMMPEAQAALPGATAAPAAPAIDPEELAIMRIKARLGIPVERGVEMKPINDVLAGSAAHEVGLGGDYNLAVDENMFNQLGSEQMDVNELRQSMADNGFDPNRPITLNQRGEVVEGYHRLETARKLGIPEVPTRTVNVEPGMLPEEVEALPGLPVEGMPEVDPHLQSLYEGNTAKVLPRARDGAGMDPDEWVRRSVESFKQMTYGDEALQDFVRTGRVYAGGNMDGVQAGKYARIINENNALRSRIAELHVEGDSEPEIRALQEQMGDNINRMRDMEEALGGEEPKLSAITNAHEGALAKYIHERWDNGDLDLPETMKVDREASDGGVAPQGLTEHMNDWADRLSSLAWRKFRRIGTFEAKWAKGNYYEQRAWQYKNQLEAEGASPRVAAAQARARAGVETRDMFYDLSARSSMERSTRNIFWYAPVTAELAYRWLYALPAQMGWAPGVVINAAKAMNYFLLFKNTGIIQQDADGRWVLPIPGAGNFINAVSENLPDSMKIRVPDDLSIPLASLSHLSLEAPSVSTVPGFLLAQGSKHSSILRDIAKVVDPFGDSTEIVPSAVRYAAEMFGIKLPDLNSDYIDKQYDTIHDQALQYAVADLQKQGIKAPVRANYNSDAAYHKDWTLWHDKVNTEANQYAKGMFFIHTLQSTVVPGTIDMTTPEKDAFTRFFTNEILPKYEDPNYEPGGPESALIKQELLKWYGQHPGSAAFGVSYSYYTGKVWHPPTSVTGDEEFRLRYLLGVKAVMSPEQFSEVLPAIMAKNVYDASQNADLQRIAPDSLGPDEQAATLLSHWGERRQALLDRNVAWQTYLKLHPAAAGYIGVADANIAKEYGYQSESAQLSWMQDTLLGLGKLSSIFTGESGLPDKEFQTVLGKLRAAEAKYYKTIGGEENASPLAKNMSWYFGKVTQYIDDTKALYDQATELQDAGKDASGIFSQITAIKNSYTDLTHNGQAYPSIDAFFYGSKTFPQQESAKYNWATKPISWLSDFQRETLGYTPFPKENEFWGKVSTMEGQVHDAIEQSGLSPTSKQAEALKAGLLAGEQALAETYGPEAVKQFGLEQASPSVRLTETGFGEDNDNWQQAVTYSSYISQALVKAGYSADSSGALGLALKTGFYTWIQQQEVADPKFAKLMQDMSFAIPAPGSPGNQRIGVPLYEALFFGQFNDAYIPPTLINVFAGAEGTV